MAVSRRLAPVLILAAVLLSGAGNACGEPAGEPVGEPGPVEVHYFFNPVSAPAVHLATQWVANTIENDYRFFLNSEQLAFVIHRVDDPLEAGAVAQFKARAPSLFIVTGESGSRKTSELTAFWAYIDESLVDGDKKTRFIKILKDRLDSALGLSSQGVTPASPAGNDRLASVDFRLSGACMPDSLDIIVSPYDADGKLLNIDAALSLSMWHKPAVFLDDRGDLLQQWDDIPVNSGHLVEGIGLAISLPYDDFQPVPGAFAYLRMTLAAGGSVFTVEKSLMVIPTHC